MSASAMSPMLMPAYQLLWERVAFRRASCQLLPHDRVLDWQLRDARQRVQLLEPGDLVDEHGQQSGELGGETHTLCRRGGHYQFLGFTSDRRMGGFWPLKSR